MRAAWYCRDATWGRTWRSVVLVTVLFGLLGAVSLAALAGACADRVGVRALLALHPRERRGGERAVAGPIS